MTRLFVDDEIKLEELYTLDSENSHYISSVLRMRIGEELVIVDSSFEEVIVSIEQITKKREPKQNVDSKAGQEKPNRCKKKRTKTF